MEELIFQTAPASQMDDTMTKTIVSKVAYLIGVPKKFFEDEYSPPQIEEYERLDQIKTARIIRNLCMFRTSIESNYRSIKRKIRDEYRTVITIEETANIVKALSEDGIEIARNPNKRLQMFVVEANKEISNRINNCKSIFPDWIVWKYLRNIFIMPNGTIEQKVQKHINDYYYKYKSWYPYMVYINWQPEDSGNILYNDRKFLTCLYKWNNDQFTDISKVSKLDNTTKFNIDEFIEDSSKLDIIVDCENSDPYKLAVTLNSLDEPVADKIHRLILIDDPNTVKIWRFFDRYVRSYEIEHIMMERIMESKSLVDIGLSSKIFREFFQEGVDSFMLCSSDSDYFAVIKGLPEARFLILGEQEALGRDMKEALASKNIHYAYIERFYSGGDGQDIKTRAILSEASDILEQEVKVNARQLLKNALFEAKIRLSDTEFEQFYKNHIKPMTLELDNEENIKINLKK